MAVNTEDSPQTETSLLLPKPVDDQSAAKSGIPNSGVDAIGPGPGADGFANDPEASENDLERHDSAAGRQRQYEGMPDVKARMKYIFPALMIGVLLASADQTIIVSSYGKIGSDLGALNKTSWIATAYFLTLTSFQPLYGKMSDIFSRKTCLLFAYIVFGIGCLGCGLARDIDQIIVSRAVAGMGGGGMTTIVSIILSDAIPLQERGTWQGYLNIVWATGSGLGAPLGGVLADSVGWRWSFLIQSPMCLIAVIVVSLTLKMPTSTEADWRTKIKRIDFLGAIVLVAAVFALLLGLDRGSNGSWDTVECLVPLCLFVPLAALFIFIEVKIASEPFAPGRIILDRSLLSCYLSNFFSFAGWMGAVYFVPLYFQAVKGYSSLISGLFLLPSIIAGVSGSLFAGILMQKTGKYYWLMFSAYTCMVLGLLMVLLFSGLAISSNIGMCVGLFCCGFSSGIGVTASLIGLIANASRDDQAIATACAYLFRSMGSTTGVALSSTASNQTLGAYLQRRLSSGKDAQRIVDGVRKSLDFIKTLSPELQAKVRRGYGLSTRAAFAMQMTITIGAAISAIFVKEKPLSAKK